MRARRVYEIARARVTERERAREQGVRLILACVCLSEVRDSGEEEHFYARGKNTGVVYLGRASIR